MQPSHDAASAAAGTSSDAAEVRATLSVACRDLGLVAPPVPVAMRVLDARVGWRVLLRVTTEHHAGGAADWMAVQATVVGLRRTGLAPRVVTVEVASLPPALEAALAGVRLEFAQLSPAGGAVVTVRGPRQAVQALSRAWSVPGAVAGLASLRAVEANGSGPGSRRRWAHVLTARQHGALAEAVARGYYEVPRRTNLRDLARTMDMSPAGLSELLRRAEQALVGAYLGGAADDPAEDVTQGLEAANEAARRELDTAAAAAP